MLSLLTNGALVIRVQMKGEGVIWGFSANEYSCEHHVTWSPKKLWRSTSILNLWSRWTERVELTEESDPGSSSRLLCRQKNFLVIDLAFRQVWSFGLFRHFNTFLIHLRFGSRIFFSPLIFYSPFLSIPPACQNNFREVAQNCRKSPGIPLTNETFLRHKNFVASLKKNEKVNKRNMKMTKRNKDHWKRILLLALYTVLYCRLSCKSIDGLYSI
jgi:hypothetical protein